MALFKRRFADVVSRQLDLFSADNRAELDAIAAARRRYNASEAEEANEAFGEYAELRRDAADDLLELRDHYAAAMADEHEATYRKTFLQGACRRFPELAEDLRADARLDREIEREEDEDR